MLVVGLVFTVVAAGTAWRYVQHRDRDHFETLQGQAIDAIDHRFELYSGLLRGTAAAFSMNEATPVEAFRRYVARANPADTFPSLRSIGFIAAFTPGTPADARAKAAEILKGRGAFWPRPDGGDSAALLIEPLDGRTQRLLGYDLMSDPDRRPAMEASRATANLRLTGKVGLATGQAASQRQALQMYMPVTRPKPGSTRHEEEFVGWSFATIRANTLFVSTLAGRGLIDEIDVDVYDGAPRPENLLYRSPHDLNEPGTTFTHDRQIEVGGRKWTLHFTNSPQFERVPTATTVLPVVAAGLVVTLSLALATLMQMEGMRRTRTAETLARTTRLKAEATLKDMSGRVVSALTLFGAMIDLETERTEGPQTRTALADIRERLLTVVHVNAKLEAFAAGGRVPLKSYLDAVLAELTPAATGRRFMRRLTVDGPDISVSTDQAVGLGVVVLELAREALKSRVGEARVGMARTQEGLTLTIDGLDPCGSRNTGGLATATAMTTDLGGHLDLEGGRALVRVSL